MKFIDKKNINEKILNYNVINFINTSWATCSDFSDRAKNHCAATAITNLALYFANNGYEDLLVKNDTYKTFSDVHDHIGNGPRIRIIKDIKKYFHDNGYEVKTSYIENYRGIKESIDRGRPVLLLLADKLFSWHWVVGIGYYEGEKDNYIRIVDGWNNSSDKYYKFNDKIKFLYGISVYMD